VRSVPLTDVSISDDGLRFSGYAAVFDKEANLGDFTEEIRRGAFRKVLAKGDNVPMYWDHDERIPPLATTRGGTLRLSEDATGLHVEATLDNDHYMTSTLRSMVRRGDVSGMSFGFIAGQGNQIVEERAGKPHRVLTGFRMLLDVSPTWNPFYEGTSVEMRSALAEVRKAQLESEQRVVSGEYQQADDGATDTGTEVVREAVDEAVQERDSGVSEAQAELAARGRRLQLMGLSLPKGDVAWMSAGEPASTEKRTREVEDLLLYPAETWSSDEHRRVIERRKAVQAEQFEIASVAERHGRNLNAEEAERFAGLQDEFLRLRR
jgi:HK97 family phage prohead protease